MDMDWMYVLTADDEWIEQVGGYRATDGSGWVAIPVAAERVEYVQRLGQWHARCAFDTTPSDWRGTPAEDDRGGFVTVFPLALTEVHFPEICDAA